MALIDTPNASRIQINPKKSMAQLIVSWKCNLHSLPHQLISSPPQPNFGFIITNAKVTIPTIAAIKA